MRKLLLAVVIALTSCVGIHAQTAGTGAYPFSSMDNRGFDSINLGNLNTRFSIPIVSKTGRGLPFNYTIQNEGLVWAPVNGIWMSDPNWGFSNLLNGNALGGYISFTLQAPPCGSNKGTTFNYSNYQYHDARGAVHSFTYTYSSGCSDGTSATTTSGSTSATDGSGYTLLPHSGPEVVDRSGLTILPGTSSTAQSSETLIDTNGNEVSYSGGYFTDTTGSNSLHVSGSNPLTLTYPVVNQSNNATTASASLTYKAYTVRTNFNCSGITEYGSNTVNLPDHITLADGSNYGFTYEGTSGASDGAVTARVASITLPTGGVVRYAYSGGCGTGNGISPDGTPSVLTRTTSDGVRTYTRALINGNAASTTVQDEKGNQTYYAFTLDAVQHQFYEQHRKAYQGNMSGTPLMEKFTCYNSTTEPCDGQSLTLPITEADVTTSFNGGKQDLLKNTYNTAGNPIRSLQYDGSGNLLESYVNAYNSYSELLSSATLDSSGNMLTNTNYGYDETTPTATSNIPQHTSTSGIRGNQTSSHTYYDNSHTLDTSTAYYDTGQPVSTTALGGFTTTYGYDATQTFATSTTLPTPSSGVALSTGATYDLASAAPLSVTGMNAGQTSTVAQYDPLLRPTSVSTPAGGQLTSTYTPNQISAHTKVSSSVSTDRETFLDSYGRVKRVAVAGSSGWYLSDSCYDSTGMLQYQSTPYASAAQNPSGYNCSTSNATQYTYDALGRTITTALPDGSSTNVTYQNRAVQSSSSNGVTRISQYDLLGRLSAVCEISTGKGLVSTPTPSPSCGIDIGANGYVTSYGYSYGSGTQTVTVQQGSQLARTFVSDLAGRSIQTNEPERGQTTYSYSYNATGLQTVRTRPAANVQDTSTATTTTTTQYDALGRTVSVAYSDGTPTKNFIYDTPTGFAESNQQTNIKGQLSGHYRNTAAGNAATMFGYDAAGRVTVSYQCTPTGCGHPAYDRGVGYQYDLAGNLTGEGDGAGNTTTFTRSQAGEVTGMTSTLADANDPGTLVAPGSVQNGPFGPTSYTLGNNLNQTMTYDVLGRPQYASLCNGGGTGLNCTGGAKVYGFAANWLGSRLTQSTDVYLNQSTSYGYDEFDRLTSTNSNNGQQAFSYAYDWLGNRWQQNVTAGKGPSPQLSFNQSNNRLMQATYDPAGNERIDSSNHSYKYDADGNVIQVDSGSSASYYNYDSLNQRVAMQRPSGSNEFVFDQYGKRVSVWFAPSQTLQGTLVYWNGKPLLVRANGATHFEHADWLGTIRMRTGPTGAVGSGFSSLAFGDAYAAAGDSEYAWEHFAGTEYDYESDTSHAQFRQYNSTQGRWMSPDPYDGSYDQTNPQSFNRYNYVMNNPTSSTDPYGLDAVIEGTYPGDPCGQDPHVCSVSSDPVSCFVGCVLVPVSLPVYSSPSTYSGSSQGGSSSPAPNNQILPCFVKGAATGAVSAIVVGGVAAGAVALGVVSAPVVTAVLGAAAVVGGVYAGYNAIQQARAGNWSGFAFGVGAFTGGALVGGSGGGRALAETINGVPSPSWSIGSDWAQGYRSNFPGGSVGKWWNSGMNPGSATGTATSAGAGVATAAKKGC